MDGKGFSFELRKAAVEDVEAIVDCLRMAFEEYENAYTPGAFADTVPDANGIRRRLKEMCLLVAVSANSIVGTIGYTVSGTEGHLRGMAVFPEWRGRGAASALLRNVENELRASGCTVVTLDTTEPLVRAIRFYEKNGFVASGKVSNFFGMQLHEYSKLLWPRS
jgi:ribosomal protein S18 acetylase RimI-like enzyme